MSKTSCRASTPSKTQASRCPSPAGLVGTSPPVAYFGRGFLTPGTVATGGQVAPGSLAQEATVPVDSAAWAVRPMQRCSSLTLGNAATAGAGLPAARSLSMRRSLGCLPATESQTAASEPWVSVETSSAARVPRPKTRRLGAIVVVQTSGTSEAAPEARPLPVEFSALAPAAEVAPEELAGPGLLEQPSGLTPASLKHLRRQRDTLAGERERLLAEITRLQALVKEQQAERDTDAMQREELQREAREAHEARRLAEVGAANVARTAGPLEEILRSRGVEITNLRQTLEDQQQSLKIACEAAERAGEARVRAELVPLAEKADELEELVSCLRQEKLILEEERLRLMQDRDEWKQKLNEAVAAADSVTQIHSQYKREMERLRPDLVTNVIRSKIELHICVPRVALEYPDAPPMVIDTSAGLSREHVHKFLQNKVFPEFDPLWMCLDGVDKAPDGTNKKAYTTRILELLTDRLKDFVDEFRKNMDDRPDILFTADDPCMKDAPRKGSANFGSHGKRLVRC